MPPCPTAVRHRPDRAVYVRRDARSLTCGSGDVLHPGPTPGSGRGVGRSRSEVRAPSGISNRCSNAVACAAVSGAARVSHSRCIAVSRTRATSWASVDTPGSSTWCSRSQTSAPVEQGLRAVPGGPRPVVHPSRQLLGVPQCTRRTRRRRGSAWRARAGSSPAPGRPSHTTGRRCRAVRPGSPRPRSGRRSDRPGTDQ